MIVRTVPLRTCSFFRHSTFAAIEGPPANSARVLAPLLRKAFPNPSMELASRRRKLVRNAQGERRRVGKTRILVGCRCAGRRPGKWVGPIRVLSELKYFLGHQAWDTNRCCLALGQNVVTCGWVPLAPVVYLYLVEDGYVRQRAVQGIGRRRMVPKFTIIYEVWGKCGSMTGSSQSCTDKNGAENSGRGSYAGP